MKKVYPNIQIGDKFRKLTVIGRDDDYIFPSGTKSKKWLCKCECGNVTSVLENNLNSGNSKSCGCTKKIYPDIQIGDRFRKLTVISRDDDYISPNGTKFRKWLCQCDCGNITSVSENNLNKGSAKSCGCMRGRKKKKVIKDEKGLS